MQRLDAAAVHADGYLEIDARQLGGLGLDALLVDVREPEELEGELGRLPGVSNVPLGTLAQAALHWDRDRTLVVICRSGGRSARGAALLVRMGFRTVINLRGGMLAVRAGSEGR
jgi:rhodanese-related sulfurtransferase